MAKLWSNTTSSPCRALPSGVWRRVRAKVHAKSLRSPRLCAALRTVAPSLFCPWGFPHKNTEMGCHALLQGIFPTQGSNPHLLCLLHWQVGSLPLSLRASQAALVVKNLLVNTGDVSDRGSIPGSGRSPGGGHGIPFQYSCLENPMDRGAWWATVHGAAESDRTEQLSLSLYDSIHFIISPLKAQLNFTFFHLKEIFKKLFFIVGNVVPFKTADVSLLKTRSLPSHDSPLSWFSGPGF